MKKWIEILHIQKRMGTSMTLYHACIYVKLIEMRYYLLVLLAIQ